MNPLAVLDFYVHESVQRGGHGKELYDKMILAENVEPRKLAYDRPSTKFKNFLAKHYNLKDFVPQNNNFIVYDDYFEDRMGANATNMSSMNVSNSRHQMTVKPQLQ